MAASKKWQDELAEAIFRDACDAFARFTAEHADESINGFAACTVDDACPPYWMGSTLESGFGPVGKPADEDDPMAGWTADPADWCWSDDDAKHRADKVEFSTEGLEMEQHKVVFDAMCKGLKKFADSGKFRGKLPREQMLLTLFIQDPSFPEWSDEYAEKLNPKSVAQWFKAYNTYGSGPDGDDDEDFDEDDDE